MAMGGGIENLTRVVERTGIVPDIASRDMRGALVSNNPQQVLAASTIAANLMDRNPNIFAGLDGRKEIEESAVAFKQYTERFGMTAEQAAQRLVREQTPEYRAQVRARVKNEDVDEIVRKNLVIGDLKGAFDESWRPFSAPEIEFTPQARQGMFNDYAELFRDRYMETGDVDVAKAQAISQLKAVWGVTQVNGSSVVMRYPPEKAPAYAGVPDVAAKFAEQALEEINGGPPPVEPTEKGNIDLNKRPRVKMPDGKTATVRSMGVEIEGQEVLIPTVSDDGRIMSADEAVEQYRKTGRHLGKFRSAADGEAYSKWLSEAQGRRIAGAAEVKREDLIISASPQGQTAESYKSGKPVPYVLSWWDRRGAIPKLQMLNPGKAFVFDAQREHERISAGRRDKLEAGRATADELRERRIQTESAQGRLRRGGELLEESLKEGDTAAQRRGGELLESIKAIPGVTVAQIRRAQELAGELATATGERAREIVAEMERIGREREERRRQQEQRRTLPLGTREYPRNPEAE